MLSYPANDFVVGSSKEVRLEHGTVTPDATNTLKRGTVVAYDSSTDKYAAVTAENAAKAQAILAEDVAAGTADVVAAVYVSGDFIENGLTVGTEAAAVELTAAAKDNLKIHGIYLTNGIKA